MEHRRRTPALGLTIDTISFANFTLDLLQTGVVQCFLTYKASQDHLDMFFSGLRAAGGYNDNLSALQVRYGLQKLLFRNSVTPSINANCTSVDYETTPVLEFRNDKRSMLVNPISTPVRMFFYLVVVQIMSLIFFIKNTIKLFTKIKKT